MSKYERMSWATPPLVYVVTLTWNQRRDTLDCMASLQELTYPNWRMLVVDNGSTDGTIDAIKAQYPAVELLVNEHNLGFQGGFNAGVRRAYQQGAEFVLVMNNDTTVQPDLLDELMAYAGLPGVGMVSPKIFYFAEPERIWSVGGDCHPITFEITHKGDNQIDSGQWSEVLERDFLVGCAMLMTHQMVEQVGLFDAGFHPIYYEDADLCVRARRAGLKLLLVPSAKMWHKVSSSAGGSGSPRERYLMARHSVRYFRKYVHGWKWLIVVPYRLGSALKTTIKLLRRGRFASAGAYWRGLRDGLRLPIATTGERL